MKKILVGYITNGHGGGIDRYLLNFRAVAAKRQWQVDFLTNQRDPELQKQLSLTGTGLLEIPSLKHPVAQYRAIRRICRAGQYDAVYFNISEPIHMMGILAAKKEHVPRRILHSHSSFVDQPDALKRALRVLLNRLCRRRCASAANEYLACSSVAARWLYPPQVLRSRHYHLILNAVEEERFRYCPETRARMRNAFGLSPDTLVIGHVGNFCYQKNQLFLMDIFAALIRKVPDAVLLAIGTGPDMDEVKARAHALGIDTKVQFPGLRSDVPDCMQAMDCLVFPSRFEGLPFVAVEAQCSGLPCILSDSIAPETAFAAHTRFLPLSAAPEVWADAAIRETEACRRSENGGNGPFRPEVMIQEMEQYVLGEKSYE